MRLKDVETAGDFDLRRLTAQFNVASGPSQATAGRDLTLTGEDRQVSSVLSQAQAGKDLPERHNFRPSDEIRGAWVSGIHDKIHLLGLLYEIGFA